MFPQPVNHVQAAHPMVAKNNQRGFVCPGFELLDTRRDVAHGNQRGAFDARDGDLLRLANVNHDERFPGVDALLDILRAGFQREVRWVHESEDTAAGKFGPLLRRSNQPRVLTIDRTLLQRWSDALGKSPSCKGLHED